MKKSQQRFKNQTIIVTGSSRGLGKLMAKAFLEEGANVVILASGLKQLKSTFQELKGLGNVLYIKCDVRKIKEVKRVISMALGHFGRIDVLINNAGTALHKAVVDTTEREWNKVVDTNLKGVFLFSQAVLSQMISRRYGRIINISSKLGKKGMENYATQSASKFGVIGFTESLAKELKNYNIRIYAICPGRMATHGADQSSSPPANNLLAPQEVVKLVLSLTDTKSKTESGNIIDIP